MSSSIDTAKKIDVEIITPHKLSIAILIRDYCQYRKKVRPSSDVDRLLSPKNRRDFCVLIMKLLQSPDLSLEELINILGSEKYEVPARVLEIFNESLTNVYENGSAILLDTVESLNGKMGISELLPASMENICFVSKGSVVGYFLRRLIVNFELLTFSEVTNVYLAFKKYYELCRKSTQKNEAAEPILCSEDWSANRDQWSRKQAELFIAKQSTLLTFNVEKALPPQELQNRIESLLKSNPSLSEAHFLSYLNYLRVKEFCLALDSLYHCFDRNALSDTKCPTEDKNRIYRYAVLNLAVLYNHFGHNDEAISSLKEAIRMAQATDDNVCLQYALCWLYRFTTYNKEKLIEHSVAKSFELNLSYTTSLGIQTFVHYASIGSGHPYLIFDTLTKGDLVNCQHNLKDLISNSYTVKAALWQFYGKTDMCMLWSQLLLHLNVKMTNRNNDFYSEAFCLAVCNVANNLVLQGQYSVVNTILNFAKDRFPNEPDSHVWMLSESIFVFVRSLHNENWVEAKNAAEKVLVFDKWEGYLRLAELYLRKQDFVTAHNYVEIVIKRCQSNDKFKLKLLYYIRAKILLAEIQFSSSYPDKVSPGIITLLNKCRIETEKYALDYYSAIIQLHIANIQLHLGLTQHSLKTIEKSHIQILAHGGCFDRARLLLLYSKSLIQLSTNRPVEERKSILLKVIQLLDQAKENFRSIEAYSRLKDVLFLQSHLYHDLEMRNERNQCAYEYRLLEEESPSKDYSSLVKFF